ncbi:MAG TPA: glycosyltransferase [Anaeromyxobacteraceae bacterium]|nr:glycosyltransferase [Anaeromyxobacteraceae bacterium]
MSLPPARPRATLVLATFNRGSRLLRLLESLEGQDVGPDAFEVVVVDDGSTPPAREVLEGYRPPYALRLIAQENAGAGAARHRGAEAARGDVLVITDDDMILPPGFLRAHLAHHGPGTRRAVLGRIRWPDAVAGMPLFERWHAEALRKQQTAPSTRVHGDSLCTGNVSMRREDYFAVGGFDASLPRGEDMDLGLRLERAGVEMFPAAEAWVIHDSDHTSFAGWRRKCVRYGEVFLRMSRKYPGLPQANPWRFFFRNAAAKRPVLLLALVHPAVGGAIAGAVERAARAADAAGWERLALNGVSLLWDVEYFRGMRIEAGSLAEALRSASEFIRAAGESGEAWPGVGTAARVTGRALARILPGGGPVPT